MARSRKNSRDGFKDKSAPELDQQIVDLARVTRVMAGGKRMRFRACVVIGDKKGRVGWAVAKGADVTIAVNKANTKAKKRMIKVKFTDDTIPHQVTAKFGAAQVLLKPAVRGTGIIAGGSVRSVLELLGIPNVYGKILGRTGNKINNVQATFKALTSFKYPVKEEAAAPVKTDELKDEGLRERDLEHEEELEKEQEKLLKKSGLEDDLIKGGIILNPGFKK